MQKFNNFTSLNVIFMKKSIFIFICFVLFAGVSTLQAQQEEEVFHVVETPPKYPGGENAMMKFLSDNIVYPEVSRKAGIQGVIYANFIIEVDGSLSNIKILRGLNQECDEEVIRVISMMPNWTPGMQRGKPVRVYFNLPVRLSL